VGEFCVRCSSLVDADVKRRVGSSGTLGAGSQSGEVSPPLRTTAIDGSCRRKLQPRPACPCAQSGIPSDRAYPREIFQNLSRTRTITSLGRQGCTGDVRNHRIVRHGPPWMIFRSRLRIPHVTAVAADLSRLAGFRNGIFIAQTPARRVDDKNPALALGDELRINHPLCLRV
jgi:hypothetical protein